MNCFDNKFLKMKDVLVLNRCIVLSQNYNYVDPPMILAIRKNTYIILNSANAHSPISEISKDFVKVPIHQDFKPIQFSKSLEKKLEQVLTKDEFQSLNTVNRSH